MKRRGGSYAGGPPRRISRRATAAHREALIYGIGVDIVHVSRVLEVYQQHPDRFVRRLLHVREYERLSQTRDVPNYLAKCFAVKEAFVKALGTGFRGIAHDDVGWVRGDLGRPVLCLSSRARALLVTRGVGAAHLALSDERDLVCAMVTLERG